MIRTKIVCPQCNQEISKSNYSKHERRHLNHPETFKTYSYKLNHEGLDCQFCGKTCKNRNSLCNHERLCKSNPDKQISLHNNFNNFGRTAWNKGLTAKTSESVLKQSMTLKTYYKTHDGPQKGKPHTDETKQKIGANVRAYLEQNPDMIPYKRNHSSNESYPESYFTKIFESENLLLQKQYPVKSYRLDFCEPSKQIDIEIDGEQHYVDKVIVEHDKVRDQTLTELGWKVIRVRWAEFKSFSVEKQKQIIQDIKNLLI